jgi:hypothetical protein
MKRFFILASAAIVALASCAKTEVRYDNAEPQEISFRQITGPMTKADSDPGLEKYHTTMGVDAIYHYGTEEAKSYFSNKVFEPIKSGETYTGDWKSNPASYWPLQGTLDFVVYAPYQVNGQAYDIQKQDLTLTLVDNRTNQTDLMVGAEIYSGKSYPATSPYDIPVTLEHALAKVTLKVKEVQATSNTDAAKTESVFYLKTVDLTATCQAGNVTVDYSAGATQKIAWTAATEDYDDL